jgi:pimeloyl-ACP methyl ester carboxylesterase
MEEEKFSILNENELDIKGTISRPKKTGKFSTLIIAGDILDTADSPWAKELCKLGVEKGFAIVRFDFTNGFGKSGGRAENITVNQRARDLELVVQYVKRRAYVNEAKLAIIGFGFGAMASLVLEGFHALAKAMVLINTPSQIDDTSWTSFSERDMLRVKLKRYFHVLKEGQEVRINYTFYEDGYRLDMFRCARNLRTPTLYLAGREDEVVKPLHSERLFERTNGKKEIEIVSGFGHDIGKKQITLIFEKSLSFFKKQKVL